VNAKAGAEIVQMSIALRYILMMKADLPEFRTLYDLAFDKHIPRLKPK
jgi:hypothetical protein